MLFYSVYLCIIVTFSLYTVHLIPSLCCWCVPYIMPCKLLCLCFNPLGYFHLLMNITFAYKYTHAYQLKLNLNGKYTFSPQICQFPIGRKIWHICHEYADFGGIFCLTLDEYISCHFSRNDTNMQNWGNGNIRRWLNLTLHRPRQDNGPWGHDHSNII